MDYFFFIFDGNKLVVQGDEIINIDNMSREKKNRAQAGLICNIFVVVKHKVGSFSPVL